MADIDDHWGYAKWRIGVEFEVIVDLEEEPFEAKLLGVSTSPVRKQKLVLCQKMIAKEMNEFLTSKSTSAERVKFVNILSAEAHRVHTKWHLVDDSSIKVRDEPYYYRYEGNDNPHIV